MNRPRHLEARRACSQQTLPVRSASVQLRRDLRSIESLKRLRDALVHYGIDGNGAADATESLLESVAGRPLKALFAPVETALSSVAATLMSLLPSAPS